MGAHALGWLPVCDPAVACDVCGLWEQPRQAAFVRVVEASSDRGAPVVLRIARCTDHVSAAAGSAGTCNHADRCVNAKGRR